MQHVLIVGLNVRLNVSAQDSAFKCDRISACFGRLEIASTIA